MESRKRSVFFKDVFYPLWFHAPQEGPIYINEVAVRIRAGILFIIPAYMAYTLLDTVFGSQWVIDSNTIVDTYETDVENRILYALQATKRTYEWTLQTWVLFYALFEMLAGMTVITSRLSPTIFIASLLAKPHPPVWKPLLPKRFAWGLGTIFIIICLIFFQPDTFAQWINSLTGLSLLPTTEQYIPRSLALTLVWVCLIFMWLEAVLGFCVGCQIHTLLVKIGVISEECEACNHID